MLVISRAFFDRPAPLSANQNRLRGTYFDGKHLVKDGSGAHKCFLMFVVHTVAYMRMEFLVGKLCMFFGPCEKSYELPNTFTQASCPAGSSVSRVLNHSTFVSSHKQDISEWKSTKIS